MKLRTVLLGLAALFVAFNAAYFSVTGLSKLFAGAPVSVILMASSLELAKLITASFLYNYWDKVNKVLRVYMLIAVTVLIIITSAGIYGFLTSAFQDTSDKLGVMNRQTEMLHLRKSRFETQLNTYMVEQQQLSTTINELSKGLSNNVIQYKDKETGQLITTTSVNTRRTLVRQLDESKARRDTLSNRINTVSDSISAVDVRILNVQINNDVTSDIGPLRFLSERTGQPMATVINWFVLGIIFVFDPLAVTLIVMFNTAIRIDKEGRQTKKKVQQTPLKSVPDAPLLVDGTIADTIVDDVVSDGVYQHSKVKTDVADTGHTEHEFYEGTPTRIDYNDVPYYAAPGFKWDDKSLWLGDRKAENYWIRHMGGKYQELTKLRNVQK